MNTLTDAEIDHRIELIQRKLQLLGRGEADPIELADVREAFDELRLQYRRDPGSLREKLGLLKELGVTHEELSKRLSRALVNRYEQVNARLEEVERERERLRQLLIEQASPSDRTQLNGDDVVVWVKRYTRRKLPAKSTPERAQLERVVRDSGTWDQVSSLQAAWLDRHLSRGGFNAQDAAAIEKLCPRQDGFQVQVQRRSDPVSPEAPRDSVGPTKSR